MSAADPAPMQWVVLTMGDRPAELQTAIRSILDDDPGNEVLLVSNGAGPLGIAAERVEHLELAPNLGVPGGRDAGVAATTSWVIGFLDDDAVLRPGVTSRIRDAFVADDLLGAVSLRLVDEEGSTQRRHVPRAGAAAATASGDVALFLGGASAMRRVAYRGAGGYFTELFYGHEELELSWRLVDNGWSIHYLADAEVFHPRTEISRHADGWKLTGRNRVWIARRTLPWPIALMHVAVWLVLGVTRAPKGPCRRAYLAGWREGWGSAVDRAPIRWRTVWRLTRLGRPPVI